MPGFWAWLANPEISSALNYIGACCEAQTGKAYHNPDCSARQTIFAYVWVLRFCPFVIPNGVRGVRNLSSLFSSLAASSRTGQYGAPMAGNGVLGYSGLLITPQAMRGGAPLVVSLATA
jgi:hypothetical protein